MCPQTLRLGNRGGRGRSNAGLPGWTAAEMTKHFRRAEAEDVGAILETLVVMGHARRGREKGSYLA